MAVNSGLYFCKNGEVKVHCYYMTVPEFEPDSVKVCSQPLCYTAPLQGHCSFFSHENFLKLFVLLTQLVPPGLS